jgi:hypothetical protein
MNHSVRLDEMDWMNVRDSPSEPSLLFKGLCCELLLFMHLNKYTYTRCPPKRSGRCTFHSCTGHMEPWVRWIRWREGMDAPSPVEVTF